MEVILIIVYLNKFIATCSNCGSSYPNAIDNSVDKSDRKLISGDCVCSDSREQIIVNGNPTLWCKSYFSVSPSVILD